MGWQELLLHVFPYSLTNGKIEGWISFRLLRYLCLQSYADASVKCFIYYHVGIQVNNMPPVNCQLN